MSLINVFSVALPYCLKRLEDGTYILLNRKYKPLGFKTREYVNYEDFPIVHRIKGITKRVAAQLSWKGSDNIDAIFLYSGTNPTRNIKKLNSYLKRLKTLSRLKIDLPF
jgi:hypothetical protein